MQLPPTIRDAIEERAGAVGFAALKRAAESMSREYREGKSPAAPVLNSPERVAAYLVTRMPATYAAARAALEATLPLLEGRAISSVLDAGAGPGAASVAVREQLPAAHLTLIERNAALADAAREWLPDADVLLRDLRHMNPIPEHDLVIASYSLGETGGTAVALRLWKAARIAMLLMEPGTPKGFAFIRQLRGELLEAGAHVTAPCPAGMPCPMNQTDWCHFAARVERSSLHRRIKQGALGYEDEKFSYIAVAREPAILPPARIIRHPQQQPGLITLETCTPEGLRTEQVNKRNKDRFRAARRAGWGAEWR